MLKMIKRAKRWSKRATTLKLWSIASRRCWMSIAIRLARAASGKDKIAFCGYHGWHDWYLSANLGSNKNLDGHLLPGLDPNGVPRNLKNTVFPFQYNDFEGLENLVLKEDIGVIKMEVARNVGPENNFLHNERKICS